MTTAPEDVTPENWAEALDPNAMRDRFESVAIEGYRASYRELIGSGAYPLVSEMAPHAPDPLGKGNDDFTLERGRRPLVPFGRGGTGKSLMGSHLSVCASLGVACDPMFGFLPSRPLRVVICDAEESEFISWRRLGAIARGMGRTVADLTGIRYRHLPGAMDTEEQARLLSLIVGWEADMVLIDAFSAALPGKDQKDPDDLCRRFAFFAKVPDRYCPLFVVLDHEPGTNTGREGQLAAFGGLGKEARVQASVRLESLQGGLVQASVQKANHFRREGVRPVAWRMNVVTDVDGHPEVVTFDMAEGGQAARAKARQALRPGSVIAETYGALLGAGRGLLTADLDAEVRERCDDARPDALKKARQRLTASGLIRKSDTGLWIVEGAS